MSSKSTGPSLAAVCAAARPAAGGSPAESRSTAGAAANGAAPAAAAGSGSSSAGDSEFPQLLASAGSGARAPSSPSSSPKAPSAEPAKPTSKHPDGEHAAQWLAQTLVPPAIAPLVPAAAQPGMRADGNGGTRGGSGSDSLRTGAGKGAIQTLSLQKTDSSVSAAASTIEQGGHGGINSGNSATAASGTSATGASSPAGASSAAGGSSSHDGALPLLASVTGSTGKETPKSPSSGGTAQASPSSAAGTGPASGAPDPSQGLAAAAAHLGSALRASASPLHSMKPELHAAVGTTAWADALGNHLVWMAHRGIESASLQVSPADLGPIEARISMHGREASVWFGASHPDTRAALEQALPSLRTLFAAQGMALADSGVFREPPRQQQPQTAAVASAPSIRSPAGDSRSAASASGAAARLGLVDLYA